MVEAIEDLFIPVLVYNNKGEDAALLKRFNEPSWNNPVTRFLNQSGSDVIDRKDRVWQLQPMAARMTKALKASNQKVPNYLSDLAINPKNLEAATFAMHCYWVGETRLGSIDGVTKTISGWAGGLEVVQVTYDPNKVAYSTLLQTARSFKCASKVFAHTDAQMKIAKAAVGDLAVKFPNDSRKAKLSDQKYQLRNKAAFRNLPLTTFQSTKLNGMVSAGGKVEDVLSPRQLKLLARIQTELKSDSNALDRFVFPDNDAKLAEFQTGLIAQLDAVKMKRN